MGMVIAVEERNMHWHFSPLKSFFSFRVLWHTDRGQGILDSAKSALRDGLAELRVQTQGLQSASTDAGKMMRTGTTHEKSVAGRVLNIVKATKSTE